MILTGKGKLSYRSISFAGMTADCLMQIRHCNINKIINELSPFKIIRLLIRLLNLMWICFFCNQNSPQRSHLCTN